MIDKFNDRIRLGTFFLRMPQVLVLAGPSGSGKDTIAQILMEKAGFRKLRTSTTRQMRAGENDGVDYDFLTVEEFMALRDSAQLLDHVVISGHHYGLPLANLKNAILGNSRIITDLTVASAFQLKQKVPEAALVFVMPPSKKEQIARLTSRGMTPDQITQRLRDDPTPISTCVYFDLTVVNHTGDKTDAANRILRVLSSSANEPENTNHQRDIMKDITRPTYFCTGNSNKLREFNEILPDDLQLQQIKIDLPEPQGVAVEEIIKIKAMAAFEATGQFVLVEDSGLEFKAWNGLPGALVKWFMDTVGTDGLIKMVGQEINREAEATTCIGYFDGSSVKVFSGKVMGAIPNSPRGDKGFGWDSIFIPDGYDKTFSEMSKDEKNSVSMRNIAIQEMVGFFSEE